ncbi:putative tetratricopeptide protein [Trichinella spiralis]|uniref:putative tetratricopeptide protein n=1 Tax=Trichinella spiralis TaxID=6334 RepID=UPI0001EFDFB7|nr:putative tetratricopeptide protein [Trichinella spiralis]
MTADRCNWLLHLKFVQKDWNGCDLLAKQIVQQAKESNDFVHYVKGALVLRHQGKLNEAYQAFDSCMKKDRFNVDYMKQVGCSLLFAGQHGKAVSMFDEALKFQPDDWIMFHWKALCYYHLKDFLKVENYRCAFDALGRALSFNPFHANAVFAAGAVMHHHEDYDVALSKYRICLKYCVENAQMWNNVGLALYGKKKYIAAISCLKRAHHLAPLEWKILYNLGLVSLEMKQLASAFLFLNASLKFNNKFPLLYVIIAVVLEQLEDFSTAKQAYEKAVKLDQDELLVPYNYATFLIRQNDITGAAQWASVFFSRLEARKNCKKETTTFENQSTRVACYFATLIKCANGHSFHCAYFDLYLVDLKRAFSTYALYALRILLCHTKPPIERCLFFSHIDCGSQNDLILSEMVNKLQLPQTMDTMATQKSGTTVVTELVDYELKPIRSLSLNSEYCCSAIALLRILEIIFGFVIVGCVTSGLGPGPIIRPLSGQHFVLIVASVFITVTFTFLVIFFLNLHKAILNSIPWRVMDICICILAVLCYFIAGSIEIWYAHVSWNYEEIGCSSKSNCGNFHITWAVAAVSGFAEIMQILFFIIFIHSTLFSHSRWPMQFFTSSAFYWHGRKDDRSFNNDESNHPFTDHSSDVSSYLSKDAEFDQARSSGGRRVVISNVRKHSNRTVTRNISDEANRLNAKNFVVASDGLENEQENVLLPQHPVFPDISMVQGELFFECTLFLYSVLVLFLQYLNLYKSLWWLPNSYTQHALKFHLIDLYVLSCVGLILGRRVIWCFLKRLTFITPDCNKRAAFWLLLVEWSLKIPATGAVLTSFSFSFIHVLAFYSRLTLTHLIYPCVFYILLFYNEIVQMFSQYDQPLFARLFNCLSDSGHADYKSLIHACSVVPSQIREEVDVFISDVYNRLKQCLFAAFTTAYYAVFIPCGFAPAYLYIDYVWVAEMSFIVFLTSGTLYLTYLFPIQLCDQLHRAAMHLGKWVYTKSYRFPQTNQKMYFNPY